MAARAPRSSNYSYERMKARHKEAYSYLSKALQIDEEGVGKESVIDGSCVLLRLFRTNLMLGIFASVCVYFQLFSV